MINLEIQNEEHFNIRNYLTWLLANYKEFFLQSKLALFHPLHKLFDTGKLQSTTQSKLRGI